MKKYKSETFMGHKIRFVEISDCRLHYYKVAAKLAGFNNQIIGIGRTKQMAFNEAKRFILIRATIEKNKYKFETDAFRCNRRCRRWHCVSFLERFQV